MQILETPLQIGLTLALVVGAVWALWRGGRAERWATIGLVAASVISPLVQDWSPNATQWGIMAVDVAYLLMLVALTVRFDRSWLPWAAAFQLLTAMTHIGMALNIELLARGYISTSYVLFVGVLGSILFGVARPGPQGRERGGRGR